MGAPQVSESKKEGEIQYEGRAYKVRWRELSWPVQVELANAASSTDRHGRAQVNSGKLMRDTMMKSEVEIDNEILTMDAYMKLPSQFGAQLVELTGMTRTKEQEEDEAKKS